MVECLGINQQSRDTILLAINLNQYQIWLDLKVLPRTNCALGLLCAMAFKESKSSWYCLSPSISLRTDVEAAMMLSAEASCSRRRFERRLASLRSCWIVSDIFTHSDCLVSVQATTFYFTQTTSTFFWLHLLIR